MRFQKRWSDCFVGNVRSQLEIAKEVVRRLEMARDRRQLVDFEESLRQRLKVKSLGLASLQRRIVRQESRLLWLKEGDAPTKFFHIQAGSHKCRNHIQSLLVGDQQLVSEEAEASALCDFFATVLGTPPEHANTINLDALDLP
jgi:hypothetical protein